MNSEQVLLLFPGQGGYAPGCVEQAAHRDPDLFEAIRSTGIAELGIDVAELRGDERPLRELAFHAPRQAHLAIYLSAVIAGRMALERAPVPAALVGHSFGEIAALVVPTRLGETGSPGRSTSTHAISRASLRTPMTSTSSCASPWNTPSTHGT